MKRSFYTHVLVASIVIAACGGGGGSSGDSNGGGGGGSNEGFESEIVYAGYYRPDHLTVKNNHLYFSDDSEFPIKKVTKDGVWITQLTIKMGTPAAFIVKEPYIYWTEARDGFAEGCTGAMVIRVLKRATLDRSHIETLQEGELCHPANFEGIAINDEYIFWVNSTGSLQTIQQVSLSDYSVTTIVSIPHDIIAGIATDDTHVYWMEEHVDPFEANDIKRVTIDGGDSEIIASSLGGFAGNLLLNESEIVWSDYNSILKVSKNGGPINTLATLNSAPKDIQMDSINIYWIDDNSLNQMAAYGSTITELVGSLNSPVRLAVGSTDLIWVETVCCAYGQTGSILSISKTGGPVTALTNAANAPGQAAFYNSTILFVEGGSIGNIQGFGNIAQISSNGGSIEALFNGISIDWPNFTTDESFIYAADKNTIKKIPIDGGFPENFAIARHGISDLTTDGNNVYWIEDNPTATIRKVSVSGSDIITLVDAGGGPAGPLEMFGDTLYWMSSRFTFKKVLTSGGTPSIIASNLPYLSDFTVDDTHLYFSENDTMKIRKISVNGGIITDLARSNLGYNILTADQDHLYWLNQWELKRIPLDGGDTDRIKSSNLGPIPFIHPSLVADSTHIYWTETAYRQIMKASKVPSVP